MPLLRRVLVAAVAASAAVGCTEGSPSASPGHRPPMLGTMASLGEAQGERGVALRRLLKEALQMHPSRLVG